MATVVPKCPCEARRVEEAYQHDRGRSSALERASRLPSDSTGNAFVAEGPSAATPAPMTSLDQDSLRRQNNQYERLISGQESEIGEVPPAYSVNATSSHSQRS